MSRILKSFFYKSPLRKLTIYFCSGGLLLTIIGILACSSDANTQSVHNATVHNTMSGLIRKDDTSGNELVPPPSPITEAEAGRIHAYSYSWYEKFLSTKGFNGGMLVAKAGNIVFEAYKGTVHIPGNDDIDSTTSLQIASTSKTFTAMAVLKLWEEGKLDINDLYSHYFPSFNYPGVTIKSMLDHRSGLPNYLYGMAEKGWDQSTYVHNQDVLNWCIKYKRSLKDVMPPDRHFRYCNTNYALLALLVEKVSGMAFPDYLKLTFFDPLNMKHTFVFNPEADPDAAPSYIGRTQVKWNYLDCVYGDKNVYTTPRDLLIWDRALSAGNLFSPATLAAAYTPYSNESKGIKNYGLGWRMNLYPNGKKMIYHNGWWHGSNASFIRLIEDSATIIIIGNKYNSNIYKAKNLAPVFGKYPGDDDDNENPDTFAEPRRTPAHRHLSPKRRRTPVHRTTAPHRHKK